MKKTLIVFVSFVCLAGAAFPQEPGLLDSLLRERGVEFSDLPFERHVMDDPLGDVLYPDSLREELLGLMQRQTPLGMFIYWMGVFACLAVLITVLFIFTEAACYAVTDCFEACARRRSGRKARTVRNPGTESEV